MSEDQTNIVTVNEKLDLILQRLDTIEERLQRFDGHLGEVLSEMLKIKGEQMTAEQGIAKLEDIRGKYKGTFLSIEEGQAEKRRMIEEGQAEKRRMIEEGQAEKRRMIEEGRAEKRRMIEERQAEKERKLADRHKHGRSDEEK
jgi:hypothetical protein